MTICAIKYFIVRNFPLPKYVFLRYFALCAFGGVLSCGITHTLVSLLLSLIGLWLVLVVAFSVYLLNSFIRSFVLVQVTPLDLVKCRLQVDKEKYKSLGNGFKLTVAEQGVRGLFLGWAPTAIGYSMQGLCKFGFYEFFKNTYSNMIGEENTYLYKTSLYLAASASAEFFADIALSPMEAVKVKMQTSKLGTFPTTLRSAAPTLYRAEGLNGRIQLIL